MKIISDIVRKVGLVGQEFFVRSVPLNFSRYSPTGVIEPLTADGDDYEVVKVVERKSENDVVPEVVYELTAGFMRTDSYSHENSRILAQTEATAWRLSGGRVYSPLPTEFQVLTRSNQAISNASYTHSHVRSTNRPARSRGALRFFPNPRHFEGVALSLIAGGGATINIAHWLMDSLPRLMIIDEAFGLDSIDHILVQGSPQSYRVESLVSLGIDENILRFIDSRVLHVSADELLVGSNPRGTSSAIFPKWASLLLRDRYLPKIADLREQDFPRKVYISRRDSSLRGVVNESEVEEILKRHGYQSVVLSDYKFLEKIALFNYADEIVSMSGAGLAFVAFCRSGTKIVEMFPRGFVHYTNAHLASSIGLDYRYMISGEGGGLGAWRAQRESVTIDLKELVSVIS